MDQSLQGSEVGRIGKAGGDRGLAAESDTFK